MRSTVLGPLLLTALTLGAVTTPATAQYGPQQLTLPGKVLRFLVHDKLGATPLQLGTEDGSYLLGRYEPTDDGDFIYGKYGKYAWGLYVAEFGAPSAASAPDTGTDGKPKTKEEAAEEEKARIADANRAANFSQFVHEKDSTLTGSRRFVVEGKPNKATSKRPAYWWWEYYDVRKISYAGKEDELIFYKTACVYDLGDREVALIIYVPLKKGNKPDAKYADIARRMLTSLQVEEVADDADDGDAKRDQFADTPERQAALKRLRDNIGDLKNWDYFTSPNYIFTYSWEADKPANRKDAKRFAKDMEARLEEIREKYVEFYPPPEDMKLNYSVIRICHDLEEFHKYGNTPMGVVGWFSPGSKELVIYYDKGHVFLSNEDEMLAVCYHEAWHQYSDQYFPGVELHRWFDEGLAEYFGSLRKKGKRWSHTYHKDRLTSLKEQDTSGKLIPTAEIVTWQKDKFYGPRAPDHYAQAWAMVDFLIRGKDVLGKRWNDRWSEILPIYAKTCLEVKSEKKAVEAAYEGVDFAEFEAAWKEWFDSGNIKKS